MICDLLSGGRGPVHRGVVGGLRPTGRSVQHCVAGLGRGAVQRLGCVSRGGVELGVANEVVVRSTRYRHDVVREVEDGGDQEHGQDEEQDRI